MHLNTLLSLWLIMRGTTLLLILRIIEILNTTVFKTILLRGNKSIYNTVEDCLPIDIVKSWSG